jgi:cupin 2 domain-containing protein
MGNLFRDIPAQLPVELTETLLHAATIRVERIVSLGHVSPPESWYDQQQHELVFVLQGAARLRLENESVELAAGDWLNIPAHQKHRVEWTTPDLPTIWLAIFYDCQSSLSPPMPDPKGDKLFVNVAE